MIKAIDIHTIGERDRQNEEEGESKVDHRATSKDLLKWRGIYEGSAMSLTDVRIFHCSTGHINPNHFHLFS